MRRTYALYKPNLTGEAPYFSFCVCALGKELKSIRKDKIMVTLCSLQLLNNLTSFNESFHWHHTTTARLTSGLYHNTSTEAMRTLQATVDV
jgi:hypothetical protein